MTNSNSKAALRFVETQDEARLLDKKKDDDGGAQLRPPSQGAAATAAAAAAEPVSVGVPIDTVQAGAYAGRPGEDFQRLTKMNCSHLLGAPPITTPPPIMIADIGGGGEICLSKAIAIDDGDRLGQPNQEAQVFNPEGNRQKKQQQERKTLFAGLFILGVLPVLSAFVLLVVFLVPIRETTKNPSSTASGTQQSPLDSPPTMEPTVYSPHNYVLSLLPEDTQHTVEDDKESPQAKALQWTLEDPHLTDYSDARIVQRFALSTFFYATGGYGWTNNTNWLSYHFHECQWPISDYASFNAMVLNNRKNPVPNAYIQFLRNATIHDRGCNQDEAYTHLDFIANNLHGTIPPELSLLTAMDGILFLGNPGLTGSLPTEIGRMSSLTSLSIQYCATNGKIPTQVGLLSNLEKFNLLSLSLSGTIPSELSLLSNNLKLLNLGPNQLTGTIPPELGSLTELWILNLWDNALSGQIPSQLGLLREDRFMALAINQISGSIPSELGMMQKAEVFTLYSNDLTGAVPEDLTNLVKSGNIEVLYLFNNDLAGTVPEDLCLVETVSDYNSNLIGCNCTCSFFYQPYFPDKVLCSPLPYLVYLDAVQEDPDKCPVIHPYD